MLGRQERLGGRDVYMLVGFHTNEDERIIEVVVDTVSDYLNYDIEPKNILIIRNEEIFSWNMGIIKDTEKVIEE